MAGLGIGFVLMKQLFKQLFSGPETCVDNFYVATRLLAGQSNQLLGKVADSDRLTHIENKHFSAPTQDSCLQDQLPRLRDGHEVTRDLRMSHCYRPTVADLLVEQGNDGAG